jgi:hypothetical protein
LKSNPPDDQPQNNPKTCIYSVIPSSFKIYTNFGKLEPATRNNLDRFGFGYQKARNPRVDLAKGTNLIRIRIIERDKTNPNQSRLGKKVLHEFKHKAKTRSNTG